MIGTGFIIPTPKAIDDALVLARIALDPKAYKANLAAMADARTQLEATLAELEAREKGLADGEAALAAANQKLDAERDALDDARVEHTSRAREVTVREQAVADREAELEAATRKLTEDRAALDKLRADGAEHLRHLLDSVDRR